mmetsp:Transcript_16565/g.36633  ORF Transcript_16565/g.36633 Transcript_16565/m.36633 type:complete len:606 (-) Transcript_16565:123-1940(-)|eukprot:CAMPEP_0204283880 /NCGR_PEP_ID=MMETSP0468-20130131/47192_1 /ASSEMBLY_ACC=CAM_ASM_000383 /TAXON_ID=2969 /ORGANISM="Oxyrrhis marina" /LENGTH=605 /DNA_ID=CAMNT_0051261549 /DNA_START=89 /DNA_END=1906 /DNA_ORIENTATION=+
MRLSLFLAAVCVEGTIDRARVLRGASLAQEGVFAAQAPRDTDTEPKVASDPDESQDADSDAIAPPPDSRAPQGAINGAIDAGAGGMAGAASIAMESPSTAFAIKRMQAGRGVAVGEEGESEGMEQDATDAGEEQQDDQEPAPGDSGAAEADADFADAADPIEAAPETAEGGAAPAGPEQAAAEAVGEEDPVQAATQEQDLEEEAGMPTSGAANEFAKAFLKEVDADPMSQQTGNIKAILSGAEEQTDARNGAPTVSSKEVIDSMQQAMPKLTEDNQAAPQEVVLSLARAERMFDAATPSSNSTKHVPIRDNAIATWTKGAIKQAVAAFVAKQKPNVLKVLKRRATDIGEIHGREASKRLSAHATRRSYRATTNLVIRKAVEYCKKLSKLETLPPYCSEQALGLMSTLKKFRLADWQKAAEEYSAPVATKEAALAAYASTAKITADNMHPLALTVAKRIWSTQFPIFMAKWKKIEQGELKRIAESKKLYWKKAAKLMTTSAQQKVHAEFWSSLLDRASKRMVPAAKTAAQQQATISVGESLSPNFILAAKQALPIAVREAHRKAMVEWTPGWSPSVDKVTKYSAGLATPPPYWNPPADGFTKTQVR